MSQVKKIDTKVTFFDVKTLEFNIVEITRYTEKPVPSDKGTLLLSIEQDTVTTQFWAMSSGEYKKEVIEYFSKPSHISEGEFMKDKIGEILRDNLGNDGEDTDIVNQAVGNEVYDNFQMVSDTLTQPDYSNFAFHKAEEEKEEDTTSHVYAREVRIL